VFRCSFCLVFLIAATARAGDVRVVEQIIAKVNGRIVTTSDLEHQRRQIDAELRQRGLAGDQLEQTAKEREKDILRDKIDTLLLVEKGTQLNLNVEAEVTKQLAAIQAQNKIADQDKFQEWIRQQSGMSFEDFKAEMRNSFLTRRVIGQEVSSKLTIPRAEARKYYDEHKDEFIREERVFLSELLLSTAGKSDAEIATLEKKAKDLVQRARNGERFSDLVKSNSDADSARDGGQLPPLKRADLNKQIADIVFSHDRNYVTDPIRIDKGFLILQIVGRHQAGLAPFEEVENDVMEKLYMPRFEPAIREYLTKLRQEAFLEIRDGYIDSGAAPGKDTHWSDPAELKPETVTKEEVASRTRRRRLLWLIPIPGTKTTVQSKSGN